MRLLRHQRQLQVRPFGCIDLCIPGKGFRALRIRPCSGIGGNHFQRCAVRIVLCRTVVQHGIKREMIGFPLLKGKLRVRIGFFLAVPLQSAVPVNVDRNIGTGGRSRIQERNIAVAVEVRGDHIHCRNIRACGNPFRIGHAVLGLFHNYHVVDCNLRGCRAAVNLIFPEEEAVIGFPAVAVIFCHGSCKMRPLAVLGSDNQVAPVRIGNGNPLPVVI